MNKQKILKRLEKAIVFQENVVAEQKEDTKDAAYTVGFLHGLIQVKEMIKSEK